MHFLRASPCVARWRILSYIVAPGTSRTPPTITRPGSPAACASTAWMTRVPALDRRRLLARLALERAAGAAQTLVVAGLLRELAAEVDQSDVERAELLRAIEIEPL